MLKFVKEQKGSVLFVEMSGIVDESSGFEQLGEIQAGEVRLRCPDVNRINSAGVRLWVRYFSGLREKNIKVTLVECSSVLVEQMNMIVNFAAGMDVESIMMPFACTKCGAAFMKCGKVSDLKAAGLDIADDKCPTCGGVSRFDDLPDEYFHFLTR